MFTVCLDQPAYCGGIRLVRVVAQAGERPGVVAYLEHCPPSPLLPFSVTVCRLPKVKQVSRDQDGR